MGFEVFRSAGAPLPAVTGVVGAQGGIRECICGLTFQPKHREHRFCSPKCSDRAYNLAHPVVRQARLDFTPAPATGEPYESARLWLLARLRQGSVCTLELRREPWPASLNPAQRVLELRNRQYQIKTERREGKTYYRLEGE